MGKNKKTKINCFVASTLESRNYVKLSEALVGFIFTWDDVHGQEKKQKDKQKQEHSQEIRTPGESKVVFRVVVGVAATMLQRQIYRFILV